MKVVIVGAGALGSLLGALLHPHADIVMLGRGEHVSMIREEGLRVEGITEAVFEIPATDDPTELPRSPDMMVFTVKAYDTAEASEMTADIPGDRTMILTLQNGLGNDFPLSEQFGAENLIFGSTSLAATRASPGVIVHAGYGQTILGRMADGPDEAVMKIQELFSNAFPVSACPSMKGHLHLKAIANAAINPLTALNNVLNGVLLERPELEMRMDSIISEGVSAFEAGGIELPSNDVQGHVHRIAADTAGNRSSMLQDIDWKRRTEVDFINGAICSAGENAGVATPVNRKTLEAVHELESTYLQAP